jgi:hypothetical protein
VVYRFEDLAKLAGNATEISYEIAPDQSKTQKRLIEKVRILYRKNDLSGPSAVGELESLALPYESYKLALTANLARVTFIDGNQNPNKHRKAAILTGQGTKIPSPTAIGGFPRAKHSFHPSRNPRRL